LKKKEEVEEEGMEGKVAMNPKKKKKKKKKKN